MNDPRHPAGAPGQHPSFGQQQQPRPVGSPQPGMPQAPRPVIPHGGPQPARPGIAAMPVQSVGASEADFDPIELVEDEMLMEMDAAIPSSAVQSATLQQQPLKSKIKQL